MLIAPVREKPMLRRRLAVVAVSVACALGASAPFAHAHGSNPSDHGQGSSQCEDNDARCDLPEAPMPIGLPIAGLIVAGGYIVLVRRRDRAGHSSTTTSIG